MSVLEVEATEAAEIEQTGVTEVNSFKTPAYNASLKSAF